MTNKTDPVQQAEIDYRLLGDSSDASATQVEFEASYLNHEQRASVVSLNLRESTLLTVEIKDERGRTVDVPLEGWVSQGRHEVQWRPRESGEGAFFCCVTTAFDRITRRIV